MSTFEAQTESIRLEMAKITSVIRDVESITPYVVGQTNDNRNKSKQLYDIILEIRRSRKRRQRHAAIYKAAGAKNN